jgi:hypothetical protein
MKKKVLLAIGFTAASLVCITPYVHSNLNGAQGPYTSAPFGTGSNKELNCQSAGCHVGNAINAAGGTVTVKLMDGGNEISRWEPGKAYTVNVTVNKPGANVYGFEICAKKSGSSTNFGTFTKGTGTRFAINTSNYITHDNPLASGNWSFTWTAPSTGTEAAKFYVAANAANGDHAESGDFIYTSVKTVNSQTSSMSESDLFVSNARILQNPVNQHLIVDFTGEVNSTLKVYTLQGKEISLPMLLENNGENVRRFVVETASLHSGMYLLSLQSGPNQVSKTFLKE